MDTRTESRESSSLLSDCPAQVFLLQDISDPQYRTFRQNIPALIGLSAAYLLSSRLFSALRPQLFPQSTKTHFLVVFEVGMLLILHGIGAFKIGLIVFLNWALTAWSVRRVSSGRAPTWMTPAIVWSFNGAMLFANDYYEGYSLKAIHPSLAFLVRFAPLASKLWHR
jgi:hypothetical protein